jgi:hypothetical protein
VAYPDQKSRATGGADSKQIAERVDSGGAGITRGDGTERSWLPDSGPNPACETDQYGEAGRPQADQRRAPPRNGWRHRGAGAEGENCEEGTRGFESDFVGDTRPRGCEDGLRGNERPWPDRHGGEADPYRGSGHEHSGGLGLMDQAQLVRFVPSIHTGEGSEGGVDDQVRPAADQKCQGGDRDTYRDAQRGQMFPACRAENQQCAECAGREGHVVITAGGCGRNRAARISRPFEELPGTDLRPPADVRPPQARRNIPASALAAR